MRNIVGILNFQYSNNNYGAVLQAAALEYVIKKNGYAAEHIDLRPILNDRKTLKNKVGDFLRFLKIKKAKPIEYKVNNSEVFEEFRCDWISRSNEVYRKVLDKNNFNQAKYSHIIVGSDQVWRPIMTNEYALNYFLDFAHDNIRRVAYAASFGVDFWDEKYSKLNERIRNELFKFNHISVREDSGVNICKKVFGTDAKHVLDPTLLAGVDFFNNIISDNNVDSKDIVYYKLDVSPEFLEELERVKSVYSLSYENIYFKNSGQDGYDFYPVDSWLSKIKNSKLVITDSFHCVCFAILFEKKFVFLPNKQRGLSRVESLFEILGIKNRICKDDLIEIDKYNNDIDYESVKEKLSYHREESLNYLINSIA